MATVWQPFLAFEGIQGAVDKNGVETVQASYYVQTLAEARFWVPADLASTMGLPTKPSRSYRQEWGNGKLIHVGKDGAYKVTLTCEGVADPSKIADEEGVQFETDATLKDDAIETNRHIRFLMAKYNGSLDDNNRVQFAQKLAANAAGSQLDSSFIFAGSQSGVTGAFSDALSPTSSGTKDNPMFGVNKFRVPGCIWTKSYITRKPAPGIITRLGKVETPPAAPDGYLPQIPDHHNWLKIIAKPTWRGNVWRVVEAWESGNWVRDVYR